MKTWKTRGLEACTFNHIVTIYFEEKYLHVGFVSVQVNSQFQSLLSKHNLNL